MGFSLEDTIAGFAKHYFVGKTLTEEELKDLSFRLAFSIKADLEIKFKSLLKSL